MDGFTAYMKKHKSTFFLFFDTFAAVRYIRWCELVDLESGEVIAVLKVGAMSEAVYSRKYRRLFLKSMLNNYLYVYDFNLGKLKKLRKFSGCIYQPRGHTTRFGGYAGGFGSEWGKGLLFFP